MRLDIFLLIWLIIIIGCVLEACFTIPYDRDFNEYKQKRDKNEHKSTS